MSITIAPVLSKLSITAVYSIDEVFENKALRSRSTVGRFVRENKQFHCARCSLRGVLFLEFRHEKEDPERSHLGLFGIANGGLRQMTRDHILPRKSGGNGNMSNLQLMCDICNNKMKGCSIMSAEWEIILHNPYDHVKRDRNAWGAFFKAYRSAFLAGILPESKDSTIMLFLCVSRI